MEKLAHWLPNPPPPTSRRLPVFQRKFVLLFQPAMVPCLCRHYCYLLLVPSSAVTCALSPTPHSHSSPIWWASCIYGEVWFWEQVGQYCYTILIQCQIPVHSICTGDVCISVGFHKLTAICWTGNSHLLKDSADEVFSYWTSYSIIMPRAVLPLFRVILRYSLKIGVVPPST